MYHSSRGPWCRAVEVAGLPDADLPIEGSLRKLDAHLLGRATIAAGSVSCGSARSHSLAKHGRRHVRGRDALAGPDVDVGRRAPVSKVLTIHGVGTGKANAPVIQGCKVAVIIIIIKDVDGCAGGVDGRRTLATASRSVGLEVRVPRDGKQIPSAGACRLARLRVIEDERDGSLPPARNRRRANMRRRGADWLTAGGGVGGPRVGDRALGSNTACAGRSVAGRSCGAGIAHARLRRDAGCRRCRPAVTHGSRAIPRGIRVRLGTTGEHEERERSDDTT